MPIFIGIGAHKFANFEDMMVWFGNPDWGLGLPMPTLMVFLSATKLIMLLSLLFSGGSRWMSLDYWIAKRLNP